MTGSKDLRFTFALKPKEACAEYLKQSLEFESVFSALESREEQLSGAFCPLRS